MLSDETLIEFLHNSKFEQDDMREKSDKLEQDQRLLNESRQHFMHVAKIVSTLFFVVLDLQLVECMYYFSLDWYIWLFE